MSKILFFDLEFISPKIETQVLFAFPNRQGKCIVHKGGIPRASDILLHMNPCIPAQVDPLNRKAKESV